MTKGRILRRIFGIALVFVVIASMFGGIFGGLVGAAVAKPPVVSRTGWGCPDGQSSPSWPPEYHAVTHIIIHHTATPNTDTDWPARVRQIWYYHTNTKGWGDIGYNYLIDPNGVIYEGRAGGDDVIAGHAYGHNVGTMGVAFLGTFSTVEPTSAALASAESLLAWKCDQRNMDPLGSGTDYAGTYYDYIAGHRDVSATECPGDRLYNLLPTIRQNVSNLMSGLLSPPTLYSPSNGQTDVSTTPYFDWSDVSGATHYWLMVAENENDLPTDPNAESCPNCAIHKPSLTSSYYQTQASEELDEGKTYYWQVQAYEWDASSGTVARQGEYSAHWSFTTTGVCPHSCWDRSALSGNELAALIRSHFPLGAVTQTGESIRVTAYAVAKAESAGNPSACGDLDIPYPGHLSIGLW